VADEAVLNTVHKIYEKSKKIPLFENVALNRHKQVTGCQRRDVLFSKGLANQPRVKETNVLARLQKLLSVKGMRGRMPCLCVVLRITFLW